MTYDSNVTVYFILLYFFFTHRISKRSIHVYNNKDVPLYMTYYSNVTVYFSTLLMWQRRNCQQS